MEKVSQRTYNKLLLEMVANTYYPCKTCGKPVQAGSVCIWCFDTDPKPDNLKDNEEVN